MDIDRRLSIIGINVISKKALTKPLNRGIMIIEKGKTSNGCAKEKHIIK